MQYENDWFANTIPTGDGGDKYRTMGARISWGDYSIGTNLFTGDPNEGSERPINHKALPQTYTGKFVNDYRAGIFYLGYGNYRFGVNSERVRVLLQNHWAHHDGNKFPMFQQFGRRINPYLSYQSNNPFTTW